MMLKDNEMKTNNVSKRQIKKSGFTLIELLVVISIIALLLAILMPALGKVKEKAKSVVCRTRLRQAGIAILLYAQDNEDEFVMMDWEDDNNGRAKYWFYKIGVYLNEVDSDEKLANFLRCPSGQAIKDYRDEAIFYWSSIDYNIQRWDSGGTPAKPMKMSNLKQPSEFAAMFDWYYGEKGIDGNFEVSGSVNWNYWNKIINIQNEDMPELHLKEKVFRHSEGINMVMGDGSVKGVKNPDWYDDMHPWGNPNPSDRD